MSQLSEFQALKALIHSKLDRYEALLKESNTPEPFLNEARLHPVMDQGNHVADKELYVTTRDLAGALDMLAHMIQLPSTHLMMEGMATYKAFALQMVTSLNMADVIKELGGPTGKPVSVEEIGSKVGLPASRVTKILRPLANSYIFQETSEGHFVNNRTSLHLLDECDVKSYVQFSSWVHPRVVPSIPDAWMKPESKDDFSTANAAFLHGFNLQHKLTDAFELFLRVNPEIAKRFDVGMRGCNRGAVEGVILDYPWSEFPQGTVCVDIGGGIGHVTEALLQHFPNLSGVVQDRPGVIEQGKAWWQKKMPEALESGRIQFDVGDFFKEIKRSGPKTVYLMRQIIHDWPDELALKILANIKAKMHSDSKVIILDTLLQPAIPSSQGAPDDDLVEQLGPVPFPLYRSGGVTGTFNQRIDLEVNVALNATERTPQQFKALIETAGLKLESIVQPRSRHGIITAVLP